VITSLITGLRPPTPDSRLTRADMRCDSSLSP
jgi:hypothetical protein